MTIWQAIFFGILQGATEFLPVSSSGHLVLFNKVLGISDNFIGFSIILHIATLFSVFIVLRKQIIKLIKNPFCDMAKKLYLSTLITVIIAVAFKDFFQSLFSGKFLAISFMFTAVLLITTELLSKKLSHKFSYRTSIFVGLMQGLAIIPGISRSGATICAGVLEGADKDECAEFSFILSIPIILGSMLFEILDCIKTGETFFSVPPLQTFISFIVSFIVGLLCVKVMLSLVKKARFYPFAIYLTILSALCLFIL